MKKFIAVAMMAVFASVAGFAADAPKAKAEAKKEVKKEAKEVKKDASKAPKTSKAKKSGKVAGC